MINESREEKIEDAKGYIKHAWKVSAKRNGLASHWRLDKEKVCNVTSQQRKMSIIL